jgi:hypothetical protein
MDLQDVWKISGHRGSMKLSSVFNMIYAVKSNDKKANHMSSNKREMLSVCSFDSWRTYAVAHYLTSKRNEKDLEVKESLPELMKGTEEVLYVIERKIPNRIQPIRESHKKLIESRQMGAKAFGKEAKKISNESQVETSHEKDCPRRYKNPVVKKVETNGAISILSKKDKIKLSNSEVIKLKRIERERVDKNSCDCKSIGTKKNASTKDSKSEAKITETCVMESKRSETKDLEKFFPSNHGNSESNMSPEEAGSIPLSPSILESTPTKKKASTKDQKGKAKLTNPCVIALANSETEDHDKSFPDKNSNVETKLTKEGHWKPEFFTRDWLTCLTDKNKHEKDIPDKAWACWKEELDKSIEMQKKKAIERSGFIGFDTKLRLKYARKQDYYEILKEVNGLNMKEKVYEYLSRDRSVVLYENRWTYHGYDIIGERKETKRDARRSVTDIFINWMTREGRVDDCYLSWNEEVGFVD